MKISIYEDDEFKARELQVVMDRCIESSAAAESAASAETANVDVDLNYLKIVGAIVAVEAEVLRSSMPAAAAEQLVCISLL